MTDFDFRTERVAVLFGGASSERAVSQMSGQGVLTALQARSVQAFAFDPAERPLCDLRSLGATRCFIALHGRWGEDGTVQGALELLRIPYTGPGVMSSAIAIDKVLTKRLWREAGLPTPAWRVVDSAAACEAAFDALGAPLIVKPAREGSTLGLAKVLRRADCAAAWAAAAALDPEVLAEQCIVGDEVTLAVLGAGAQAQALPLVRIVAEGDNYDYQAKYFTHTTRYLVPSGLPAHEESAIADLVLRAYRSLGARGWARADVMIDAASRAPYLLELNTSPGMTSHSLVPMAARAAGLSYEDLCLRILASATLDHPTARPLASAA